MKVFVARDMNGAVSLFYGREPIRGDEIWLTDDSGKENCNGYELGVYLYPSDVFEGLTWENSPRELVLK